MSGQRRSVAAAAAAAATAAAAAAAEVEASQFERREIIISSTHRAGVTQQLQAYTCVAQQTQGAWTA